MVVVAFVLGALLGHHHHAPVPVYPVTETGVHLEYRFAIDGAYVSFDAWNKAIPDCLSVGDYVTDIPGEEGTAMAVTFYCNKA
jgi:carbohydrate-selective porin OprB